MNEHMNRRDFLKLSGLLPLSVASPGMMKTLARTNATLQGRKNVIVVLFDALSAYNISLYGYQRLTTPNLAKLADRAVVYHNHFAGSNFTTSGTASLLTGTLPWTHRALQDNGQVAPAFLTRNIFSVLQDYYRISYTHNGWAYTLLRQFRNTTDEVIPPAKLFLGTYDRFIETLFNNDADIASVSWERGMKLTDGYSYSLFLSHLYRVLEDGKVASLKPLFPRGLPTAGANDSFLLEQAVDWIGNVLTVLPQPFFGYFHFLPPHAPYRTSLEFFNVFGNDDLRPVQKPIDIFGNPHGYNNLLEPRREYDEFILYADKEFGRLLDAMEASGLLENTWVIFTSDHGEMFERGILGHSSETLYQPLVRIPLLIFEPGRKSRLDIQTPTSAVDILPTLAHLTGHAVPEWCEGILLPPYASVEPDPDRHVYAVEARTTNQNAPLTQAATTLIRGRYKLLYYFGYRLLGIKELVKLYDIQADPEELVDLFPSQNDIGNDLLGELKSKIAEENKPYL